jgi:hypothetical protein
MSTPTTERDGPARIRLHPLTYVSETGGVLVGRPDTGSYAVLPPAGADILQSLASGATVSQAAAQWHRATGEVLDVEELTALLADLGFLVGDEEEPARPQQPRWYRLGRWLFSPTSLAAQVGVVLAALAVMVAEPDVRPSYRHFFFTEHLALIPILLTIGQIPLVILHEAYHALAARRLGLPSRVSVGRRFFYLVAQTHLDALYSVPRRQRYLPMLAGGLFDLVSIALFTLSAQATYVAGGPGWLAEVLLAFAMGALLRLLWQGLFYLETDLYFVVNTASGCTDLHGAARYRLRRWWARACRRRQRPDGAADGRWSEHDHAMARWYAPLMIVGYLLSALTLVWVALPTARTVWMTLTERFATPGELSASSIVDTVALVAITATNLCLLAYVVVRDWRARRRARTPLPTTAQEET